MSFDGKTRSAIRRKLLNWFDQNQRALPWRKQKTPYRIWISEIMLQQTQVATVIPYYQRFIKAFPNPKKLAAAAEQDILLLWEGLGYYRRARQLHAAAKVIVEKHAGKFPTQFDQVIALPGIGRYTAGAILSISLDQPHPILEGNTIRVFSRLTEMDGEVTNKLNVESLWDFSTRMLPRKRAGDVNQAFMELGSEICKPRNPLCTDCPLRLYCPTRANNRQKEIPKPKKPPKYEDVHEAALVVCAKDKLLMRLCQPGERWAGLWDFPRFEINSKQIEKQLAQELKSLTGLSVSFESLNKQIKHAVTRFRITLDCFQSKSVAGSLKSATSFQWVTRDELTNLPLSVTGRKLANYISKG